MRLNPSRAQTVTLGAESNGPDQPRHMLAFQLEIDNPNDDECGECYTFPSTA